MGDIIKETEANLFINGDINVDKKKGRNEKRDRVRGEGFLCMLCHV